VYLVRTFDFPAGATVSGDPKPETRNPKEG